MFDQLLLLVDAVNHLLCLAQQPEEVQTRDISGPAIVRSVLRFPAQACGLGQHPGGHTAVVGASASQAFAFDQRHGGAQLAGP